MFKVIVVLILALAIGMAIPQTRAMIERQATPITNRIKAKIVPSRLKAMADELAVRIHNGKGFPPDWDAWLRDGFTGDAKDPWGHEYYMNRTPVGFTVGSVGPDGRRGGGDDITLTRRLDN